MATATLNTGDRPSPFTVSIKKVGDNTERFVSKSGSIVEFNSDIGSHQYISEVTDSLGRKSTASFPLTCAEDEPDTRPDCTEGPEHNIPTPIDVQGNTGAVIGFHATGVNPLEWVVAENQNDTEYLRQGIAVPIGPYITILYDALDAGAYQVGIRGVSCKSPWSWRELLISEPEEDQELLVGGYFAN